MLPPTPVPRITPNTVPYFFPAPSSASDSAKQLASLAIRIGRPRIFSRSFLIGFFLEVAHQRVNVLQDGVVTVGLRRRQARAQKNLAGLVHHDAFGFGAAQIQTYAEHIPTPPLPE